MKNNITVIIISVFFFLTVRCGNLHNDVMKKESNENDTPLPARIVAYDAAVDDEFGYSVSISGDYAIVGADRKDSNAGAAYIFYRTSANIWDTGTKIVASDSAADDYFGYSVSISENFAIVGAYYKDAQDGAVYIFQRTGQNTWDGGYKIAAPAALGILFGYSVSIYRDYAIAGAPNDDAVGVAGDREGAAYIFHRTNANVWDAGAKIVASDAAANDWFGKSVSINGDYAIVGATGADAGGSSAGAAYIYYRTNTNTWGMEAKIVASDAAADDAFGYSVSISGDYVIVGATGEDGGAGDPVSDAGAAYIFHRTGTNKWDGGTKITASNAEENDDFGGSVSIDGDYAIVGGGDSGKVYIFHRTGTNTWEEEMSFKQENDYFGKSVSINGDYVIIGADSDDSAASGAGAAYIYKSYW